MIKMPTIALTFLLWMSCCHLIALAADPAYSDYEPRKVAGAVATFMEMLTGKKFREHEPQKWPSQHAGALGNFSKAAVAADNGICSEIGRDVLIKGGNAVDATIATTFCVGVLGSHSSGIGGGHIMTIYNKEKKKCWVIDARETAPSEADRDMYEDEKDLSKIGWLAVGVPGEVYGLYTAFKLAGSGNVDWEELVTPTADLCENGFPVSGALAAAIASEKKSIMKDEVMRDIFVNPHTGHLYKEGELMHQPRLADTLYGLAKAKHPIKWFYNSSFTEEMVDEFNISGGILTKRDFKNYRARYGESERPVIKMQLDSDLVVCGPPPPSSAAITMAILNIMQGYNITPAKLQDQDFQIDTYHRLLEAFKLAYGTRMKLGDINYVRHALSIADYITSPEFGAHARANNIDKHIHQDMEHYSKEPGFGIPEDHGTTHVSVIDEDGNAVALTSTINYYFGARVASNKTGIIWNDQMDDFSKPKEKSNHYGYGDAPNNYIKRGKRPLSSMSPLIIYNGNTGNVKLVAGTAGGSRIITATAQMIMRVLWFGQNLKEAVESPRLHNQLNVTHSEVEDWFPEEIIGRLKERGHEFAPYTRFSVASTAVHRGDDGRVYAYSDYRKPGGHPSGY